MSMRTINVIPNQSLSDIAIEYYGSVEGVFLILEDNRNVSSVNDRLITGQELIVRSPLNARIVSYLNEPVATLDEHSQADGIGYMTIGIDFIVG